MAPHPPGAAREHSSDRTRPTGRRQSGDSGAEDAYSPGRSWRQGRAEDPAGPPPQTESAVAYESGAEQSHLLPSHAWKSCPRLLTADLSRSRYRIQQDVPCRLQHGKRVCRGLTRVEHVFECSGYQPCRTESDCPHQVVDRETLLQPSCNAVFAPERSKRWSHPSKHVPRMK